MEARFISMVQYYVTILDLFLLKDRTAKMEKMSSMQEIVVKIVPHEISFCFMYCLFISQFVQNVQFHMAEIPIKVLKWKNSDS